MKNILHKIGKFLIANWFKTSIIILLVAVFIGTYVYISKKDLLKNTTSCSQLGREYIANESKKSNILIPQYDTETHFNKNLNTCLLYFGAMGINKNNEYTGEIDYTIIDLYSNKLKIYSNTNNKFMPGLNIDAFNKQKEILMRQ